MSALPDAVAVTFFADYAAALSREDRLSPADIAQRVQTMVAPEKSRLPWLKLARFGVQRSGKNSLRHDGNVLAITGIEADYDGEKVSFDTAVEIAEKEGLGCIIYTCPSHTPDKPRWRVLCPLSQELPPEDRYRLVARLNGLYGGIFSGESFTLSQSYYFGKVAGTVEHRVEVIDGEPIDLLDELDEIAIGRPNGQAPHEPEDGSRCDPEADIFDVFAALAVIPNSGRPDWEEWNRIGLAICGATRGSAAGGVAFDTWSKKNPAYDAALTRERWLHIAGHPPNRIGAGTLLHLAAEARPGWRKPSLDFVAPRSGDPFVDYGNGHRPEDEEQPTEEAEDFNASQSGTSTGRPRPTIFDAGRDEAPTPPRGWLLGTTLCRRFLSSLLGGGGTGKTALRIAQALALATGRPLSGEHVFLRCRVLLICLEDDIDELRRRVRAAMIHYRIDKDDVEGWLFYASPGRGGGKLLERVGNQLQLGWMAEWLVDDIKRLRLDAVIIDPLVKAHSAVENSNDEMDLVADVLAQIAHEHDIAVDTPHHIRKGPAEAGNADQGRGGGATKDAARLVYTLTPMSEDEAARFNVPLETRRRFMRMDPGKVNLVPAADAQWFELVGVRIGNCTVTYPNGDEVQVAVPWAPPDTWEGLSHDALNAALTDIDAGKESGERFSGAPAAKERAAWQIVQRHCPDKSEKQCREIIRTWIKNGVLFEEKYEDPIQRKALLGLRLNHAKRPS